eukprot:scaffold2325_cov30-Tisochrysis_lutea.AAC.4
MPCRDIYISTRPTHYAQHTKGKGGRENEVRTKKKEGLLTPKCERLLLVRLICGTFPSGKWKCKWRGGPPNSRRSIFGNFGRTNSSLLGLGLRTFGGIDRSGTIAVTTD